MVLYCTMLFGIILKAVDDISTTFPSGPVSFTCLRTHRYVSARALTRAKRGIPIYKQAVLERKHAI